MALGYYWTNITGVQVSRGSATVNFWIDVKLNRQDTAGNYSVVDTRLTSTISGGLSGSGYSFSLTGSAGTSGSGVWTFENETILTGQTTIYHNDDGTKRGSASAYCYNGYWNINEGLYGEFDLPTIARASQPSINTYPNNSPDFNIGDNITIHTNRKSSSFTHTIKINYGNTSYTIATGVGANYVFDTSLIANNLYALIPNTNVYSNTISVDTYSGSTKVGTKTCAYTAHVVNSDPIFTDFTFADINPTTLALTGDYLFNVNGYSTINVTISTSNKAVAQNGATMSKYRLVIGNDSVDINYSASEGVTGAISNSSTGIYTVYAIDSRGNSTAVTKQADRIVDYTPLVRTTMPKSTRDSSIGEEYTLKYAGEYWNQSFGDITNSIKSATYRFKKTTNSTWTTGITNIMPTSSNNTFSFQGLIKGDTADGFDISDSYNIELTIEDELSTAQYSVVLISGRPNMAVAKEGVAIGRKYDTNEGGTLQIDGKSLLNWLHPVGSVYASTDSTSPATLFGGTWSQITDDAYFKIVTANAGQTGGTSSEHKIPLTSMPSHNHTPSSYNSFICASGEQYSYGQGSDTTNVVNRTSATTSSAGGGQAYYPYYYGIYAWVRTA